mmetsp:Transcript_17165/g.51881  ORF Transcript_17165/g.51881 Transcript_17165/m.51881 type:complete len:331 (-) Transcript_17165:481-1473(-)
MDCGALGDPSRGGSGLLTHDCLSQGMDGPAKRRAQADQSDARRAAVELWALRLLCGWNGVHGATAIVGTERRAQQGLVCVGLQQRRRIRTWHAGPLCRALHLLQAGRAARHVFSPHPQVTSDLLALVPPRNRLALLLARLLGAHWHGPLVCCNELLGPRHHVCVFRPHAGGRGTQEVCQEVLDAYHDAPANADGLWHRRHCLVRHLLGTGPPVLRIAFQLLYGPRHVRLVFRALPAAFPLALCLQQDGPAHWQDQGGASGHRVMPTLGSGRRRGRRCQGAAGGKGRSQAAVSTTHATSFRSLYRRFTGARGGAIAAISAAASRCVRRGPT